MHDEPPARPGEEQPPPAPPWVKALGVALVLLALLAVLALVLIGGEHGPGRHT